MSIIITDKALKEIRSRAEKQKIKHVALYLDVAQQCCCISAFAKVIEQPNAASEAIRNVADMPIYSCNLIK